MSSIPIPPPLTDDQYHKLNAQLDDLARLQAEIIKAAQAGCDVTEQTSHCNYLIQQLQALKRVYFPNRP